MQALAHVMIRVRDFDVSVPFYTEILGLREAFRLEREDGTPWIVYLHVAGRQFVELSLADGDPPGGSFVGFAHVCFEVSDIHAHYDRLRPSGCVIPDSLKLGKDGSWQFWIKDPDGNRIELMQYTPESRQAGFLKSL